MKYYAIGTPVGCLNEGSERYFMREGLLLNVDAASFALWIRFLHGADFESAVTEATISRILRRERLLEMFDKLVEAELLASEQDILDHVPQRQGYGIGFSQKEKKCYVDLNGKIEVSYPAYLLWAYCDGKKRCREIVKSMPAEVTGLYTDENLLRVLDELLRENLIVFAE